MGFTDQIKAALAKKQAAQHPEKQDTDAAGKAQSLPTHVRQNKPQKKVTGRGR